MNGADRWFPFACLVQIVVFTLLGIVLGPRLRDSPVLDGSSEILFVAIVLGVGIAHILTVRFFVLPGGMGNPDAERQQIVMASYQFAIAPAIYGLITSIFTTQGLLALPFGAIALWGFFLVWSYLRDMTAA